ncbi:pectin esterase, partial [Streptomyces sp. PRKS01-65]|nr:pectin esterase [Streptomyces harenosi]
MHRSSLSRRALLLTAAGAGAALGLAAGPATAGPRPFGRYGSPAARLT